MSRRYRVSRAWERDLLERDPQSGRACDEIKPGYWRYHEAKHVIFYKLGDSSVEIMRVLHERMLPELHL